MSSWSPKAIGAAFGVASFLMRLPFVFRYDLHFGGDSAICYLMALRITHGDRPVYFYGQDYQGAPEAYLAALIFTLIGPSIPAAAVVSLVEWAIAVAIGVYLAVRATNPMVGAICGIVTAVGVPYTLHYVTVPYWGYAGSLLIGMCVLLQIVLIVEKGPSIRRGLALGVTIGVGLYIAKLIAPAVLAALLGLIAVRSRLEVRARRWMVAIAAGFAGFLLGYAPEVWYRLHASEWRSFSGVADGATLWSNLRFTLASIPAYFDGQPVSRFPEGTNFFGHFYAALPDTSIYPAGIGDWLAILIAAGALIAMLGALVARKRDRNIAGLLLALLVLLNLAAVVVSKESNGWFLNTRRYLFPSAIAFSIWTGVLLAMSMTMKPRWIRIAGAIAGVLFASRVLVHEYGLLRGPDELHELRQIVAEMQAAGVTRGVATGQAYEIAALTNEGIIVTLLAGERIPEYADAVSAADRIAVIRSKGDGSTDTITFRETVYGTVGPPHEGETLRWWLYERVR